MNKLEASLRIHVYPTNPGQFLACCGMLELADRLWDGVEGWFENGEFCLVGRGTLAEMLDTLVRELPNELTQLANSLSVKPLIAPLCLSIAEKAVITLDAWMTIRIDKGKVVTVANAPWNFWSGQQTSLRIWTSLRAALANQLKTFDFDRPETLFSQRVPLSGRFGFDPSAAWNALDVGFSPNEQKIEVASSPAVELLAAVGLQRFRPMLLQDRYRFSYCTWGHPLPPSIAAAAMAGMIAVGPTKRFIGRVVSRGSYSALGYSTPSQGDFNE